MGLLIRNAEIIDPAEKISGKQDVLLEGGLIAAIGKNLPAAGHETIDATGLSLLPGLIDIHVHFRDPGQEYKETIETGLRAAAAGGVTSVVVMPNTNPPADSAATVGYMLERAQAAGLGRLYVAGAISKGRAGKDLAEMGDMFAAGIVAVTDDGSGVADAQLMRRALEYSRIFKIPVMAHEEDADLAAGGVMHEGLVSTTIGLRGIPSAAEEVMVARDAALAEATKAHLHVTHVSAKNSIELIRASRARGARVTCDVAPHHLTLTDEAVYGFDTSTKVNPPLRPRAHVDALIAALAAGDIEAVASDHAPHAAHEKERSYDDAPFGLIGLETTFALLYTDLVLAGKITFAKLVARMTTGPADILGLPQGRLETGSPADVILVDASEKWTVQPEAFHSKGRNCPFAGRELTGRVIHTFAAGKHILKDKEVILS